ncbi:MAG: IS30 family transposase [bacterium]|nr:IS30 family transposase [bacterium]
MTNKKKHPSKEERFCIEKMLGEGESFGKIARTLNRGLSTVSEEVNSNKGCRAYRAKEAGMRAYLKQYRKKRECNAVAMNAHVQKFVEKKLKAGWSPETIASRMKDQSGIGYASGKSIRKYIDTRSGLERFLFWNRNNHKPGPKRRDVLFNDPTRKYIDERPTMAFFEYGHWEGDFIVSKHNSFVLLVLVEKWSKVKRLKILPNRNNTEVNEAIRSLLEGYTVKTLTLDNDIAFRKWRELEMLLEAQVYFCHPYHSWEKGLVENANRWIREFVPKRSDLAQYTHEYIQMIEDWFNHLPSQSLLGVTPYEKMMEKEYQKFVTSLEVNFPTLRIRG